jgi:hypothetical protein
MFEMMIGLKLSDAFYFVADKYYCSGRFMKQLIAKDIHLVTKMQRNAVAYYPAEKPSVRSRGRPKKYGEKVKLFDLFNTNLNFIQAPLPGNSKIIIEYCAMQLLWRPLGDYVQFVFVRHPEKGLSVSMSSDLTISPLDIILIYLLRFKIEVTFKQAVHQIGVFRYRFWLKMMPPIKRGGGDQFVQFSPCQLKERIVKKLNAYHTFIPLGLIAQGLVHYLSIHCHQAVWKNFGTWLRTIRENILPSEKVVSLALGRTYIEFLMDATIGVIFKKFLLKRIDISQLQHSNVEQKEAA